MSQVTQIVEVLLENALDTYESQQSMLGMVNFFEPDGASMQISGNTVWRPVEQHAPIIEGFDIDGQEQDIIEEAYPAVLGTPQNDFVVQRADQVRDLQYWKRRGKVSGRRQASNQNQAIVNAMYQQGSMFYSSSTSSGYEFIAEGQALMNERQGTETMRYHMLNDRDTLTFSGDLAARQTIQGRPESDAWTKGQIGANVAGFDVHTGSFLPNIVGGASPDATVTGTQSFAPEGGSINATTKVVTNIDYREAVIPVSASGSYNVGDKIKFVNGGDDVIAVGLDDKTETGQAMTFTVVDIPDGTSLTIFPKPIALDDAGLTVLEKAYANINTQITNAAVVERLNTAASSKVNLFWDKDAVEVLGGTIPAELFKQFDGMQVVSTTMSNGQEMYILYDGNIGTLNFRFRIFTWFGVTIADPSRVGVALTT